MATAKKKSVENESKQIHVYNQIKEDILNGTFPPGTVMVERKLCDRYEVSRSPIRAALQMLVRDGLLSYSRIFITPTTKTQRITRDIKAIEF